MKSPFRTSASDSFLLAHFPQRMTYSISIRDVRGARCGLPRRWRSAPIAKVVLALRRCEGGRREDRGSRELGEKNKAGPAAERPQRKLGGLPRQGARRLSLLPRVLVSSYSRLAPPFLIASSRRGDRGKKVAAMSPHARRCARRWANPFEKGILPISLETFSREARYSHPLARGQSSAVLRSSSRLPPPPCVRSPCLVLLSQINVSRFMTPVRNIIESHHPMRSLALRCRGR